MKTKNLVILAVVAAGLVGVSLSLTSGAKPKGAALNGKTLFPGLEIARVATIEFGDRLKVVSGADGWTVPTFHGYPADRSKIAENLLKLAELKVGQTVRGKTLEGADELTLRDAEGKEVACLQLGARHAKWGHGRYAKFSGETVLVSDALDAFDGDGKAWVETKIVDDPWISFNDIAEGVDEAELGFATGVVAKVTIAGDTNRTVTVGNVVKGGGDRYLKLDNEPWIYRVSGYSVEKLLPKPEPKEEPKPEPVAEPPTPPTVEAAD